MKKRVKQFVFGILLFVSTVQISSAQEEKKPTIAVALPNIENMDVSRSVVAKLIQIELIKLDMYSVYDEFDIQEAMASDERFLKNCHGKNCLIDLGRKVNVDYIASVSILSFGGKIVITSKFIDVKGESVYKSDVKEFIDDKKEIQRMLHVVMQQLHSKTIHSETVARISFDQQPVIKANIGRINNS
jgi:hypothetical protein